jgi:hypothetical protein
MIPDIEPVLWAFEHFYHMDSANAKIHCAPVRFSPITFRLCDYLMAAWRDGEDITEEMGIVSRHVGQYAMDKGR